jgi:hypothetical protein
LLHPHRAREIRRRHQAVALDQLGELLRRALEGHLVRRLGVHDREHPAADAEREVGVAARNGMDRIISV